MKICLITYGCKVNQAESQKWERILNAYGYEITDEKDKADFWIINTCAVTHKAEIQSRQIINKAKKLGIKTFVTGCYVNLTENLDGGNIKFIPNCNKDLIINNFSRINESKNLKISRHRAIIKIQDGCNNYCSYCIVPYLRGKPKSIPPEEILEEINLYESMGIKEIILSGINLGLYGIDFSEKRINLKQLLKQILKKTSIYRIRLSSIEINHIDEEFLDIIDNKRICKHLHIPLQHGSDRILKLMNRPYNTELYLRKFEEIIKRFPNISIGTDVIIGFPSEKDYDFIETLKIIEDLSFSYLHVFPYSRRPFTKASKMSEQVHEQIKKERVSILNELASRKRNKYLKNFIGKIVEVIVESRKNNLFSGTSDNYIKCFFKDSKLQKGDLAKIIINNIDKNQAFGKLVN
ncbi:tRNA (N(6)-L-threonylcarbamoyladenosine(37)-C(2))-methylthiotransferase MtaB [Thermodesulfovibrio sp. 1176]|uniref:tRNA (N(6)-L-threonylcarbamoyladenosine(37)-C(2))- methylthiotransferase MtaB n=2 Tax=unclassified Thermodesulfovibrio TaxID=2645936 RepID=UPI00248236F8|nr:tRNA (N(6)-L-threonylcarbamoyladenosine(37)-C(2))-methylthiotransferase MtaB [Thermodesulfovibrio sp. 1176]MDI1472504.1 tRNA (N(6)-L-threonylcarbamoyladenosine(37)-C(2))-methylthiotransferase MtaB [Thermodesulfovibrio sp. 1176]